VALGATLALAVLAPQDAAAQSGRQRAEDNRGVIIPQGSRTNGGVYSDGVCRDQTYGRYDNEGRGKHKDKHDKYDKRRDHDDDDRYDRDRDQNNSYDPDCNYSSNDGRGPKFCQNGQGHPVYGMAWCRQKGYGNYSMRDTGWRDVILRRPRYGAQGDLSSSALQQVLGRNVYNRFEDQAYRLGVRSPLEGRWLDMTNGSVLNLFAGGLQIAEIVDRNRDGRADVVRLNYGR
jgi:hypothetical protein